MPTSTVNHAKKIWNKAAFKILEVSLGTGFTSSLPTPTIEVPKQISISAVDLALCFYIYRLYFDEDIQKSEQVINLMKRAGLVTVSGGTIVYIGYKAARGLFDEIANFCPAFWTNTFRSNYNVRNNCYWFYLVRSDP